MMTHRSHGFTMLEILIAVGILSVVLTTIALINRKSLQDADEVLAAYREASQGARMLADMELDGFTAGQEGWSVATENIVIPDVGTVKMVTLTVTAGNEDAFAMDGEASGMPVLLALLPGP